MSLLYELSDDPEQAIFEIHAYCSQPRVEDDPGNPRDRLLDEVRTLLTDDDYVDPKVIERLASIYKALDDDDHDVRGPLGLCLCLSAALAYALTSEISDGLLEKARHLFAESPAKECFRTFYDLGDDYDLAAAELHRVGTTSLILKCPTRPKAETDRPRVIALKCLLPRYHKVRAITARTDAYKEEHSLDLPGVPYVYNSTPLTIAMDFIEGPTLADELEARAVPDHRSPEEQTQERAINDTDIEFIREVGLAICEKLSKLIEHGHRHHLDLSPSNIILVNATNEPIRIALIDFGHNFAISERVGTSAAFRRASLYVAPELLDDPSIDDWRCDAYSLGVILLEAAAKRKVQKEDLAAELDRLWQGERPWDGAPGLARAIEELIEREPAQRLALMSQADSAVDPYTYLSKLVLQETEVLEIYENRTTARGFGLLRGIGLLKLINNDQLMNLFDVASQVQEPVDDAYADFPSLARWAVVAMACWVVALSTFAAYTLADLGWATVVPWVPKLTDTLHAHFKVGDFWANLPGRLVALTFGLTAVTYYVNNFSTLSPKRLGVRIGNASEVVMRATSIGLVFPIMWAMVYAPQTWPLCAGIGTMLVVVNNFLALRIAIKGNRVGWRFSTRRAVGDRFITDVFKEWWVLMGAYSLAMIVIGILLMTGLAHDETIFAVLVIVINVAKMYRLNCVETAPQVRGCLSRDILTLRRADELRVRGIPAPVDSGLPNRSRFASLSRWLWTPAGKHADRRRTKPATGDSVPVAD
jgi:serine/threonine protein kinase